LIKKSCVQLRKRSSSKKSGKAFKNHKFNRNVSKNNSVRRNLPDMIKEVYTG
jgi:hypothetical protein